MQQRGNNLSESRDREADAKVAPRGPRRRFMAEPAQLGCGLIATTAYFLSIYICLSLVSPWDAWRGPLWPAAGIALSALLLSQRWGTLLLALFMVDAVARLLHGASFGLGLASALLDVGEAWVAARLLRKYLGRSPEMSAVADVLKVVLVPALLVYPFSSLLSQSLTKSWGLEFWIGLVKDWAATLLGLLLICPLILAWKESQGKMSADTSANSYWRFSEVLGLFITLFLVSTLVFSRPASHVGADLHYLVYPAWFLLAIRCSLTQSALASLLVTTVVVGFTAFGLGPFSLTLANPHGYGNLVLLAFIGVGSLSALVLSALTLEKALAEQALLENKNLFENLIDNIPAFISVKSVGGQYLLANQSNRELFGKRGKSVVGKTDSELFSTPEALRMRERDLEVLRTGQAIQFEESRHLDGKLHNFLSTCFPLYQKPGSTVVICSISTDITHLKELEAERLGLLEREKAARQKTEALFHEAQRLNRLKDEFLMTLSHELRVPLHGILGWTRILATAQVSEEERQVAYINLKRSVEAESRVIDELLDISRILTQKIKVKFDLLNADEIVASALKAVSRASIEKRISIESSRDNELHLVHGDARRLEQVLINVLVNAIKFTPNGGRVSVRVERLEQQISIIVSDTGIGIEAEEMPHIFKRFWQADSSLSRSYGGLGLGLALVQELVNLHGGSIKAESRGLGKGATFTLHFPAAVWGEAAGTCIPMEPREPEDVEAETTAHLVDLSRLSLLAIDDDQSTCLLISAVLSGEFREVRTATSAQEAMDILQIWQPDFVLCDIAMPGEDGLSFIRRARALAREQNWELHAAALSANADEAKVRSALQEGFEAYLTKPVDPVRIIEVIRLLLSDLGQHSPYLARLGSFSSEGPSPSYARGAHYKHH